VSKMPPQHPNLLERLIQFCFQVFQKHRDLLAP
jgi:hypothetical protein